MHITHFEISDPVAFKVKMLNWINRFNIFCFLDSHHYEQAFHSVDCIAAVSPSSEFSALAGNAFNGLREYAKPNDEWLFGFFSYDLKNETEQLTSNNLDGVQFPDLHFFRPQIVLELKDNKLSITSPLDAQEIFTTISEASIGVTSYKMPPLEIKQRISRDEYLQKVNSIKEHIAKGDCYEINFCQEFFAENVDANPLSLYHKMSEVSPAPFAVFYKLHDRYCISASPERYLKRVGQQLISQPIKGTIKRDKFNEITDAELAAQLRNSPKEQSENVMVVDLVRNDLSRICKMGSVKVDELFGIYSFTHVHQMISTVVGELEDHLNWVDAIAATFPMGSMTGAPKKRVMEIVENFEETRRGLFSGAVGYVKPNGDFDFNVIIRTMLYNETSKYLSFQTGGAITHYANAEAEYEECMLKAEAMIKILS